ncbi:MAG: DUF3307 domain-containing protein [Bacteroidetes bacterium]|nr:DUF3307 domain-containing protein [Bacteroidota bacterium]
MILLIKLILIHFIGDFVLQPKSWVKEKENKKATSPKLYLHVFIHGLLVLLIVWNLNYWLLALMLTLSHLIIDVLKLYAQKEKNKTTWFLIDQALHLISILVVWFLWFNPVINLTEWAINPSIWIYTTAILFITIVSGIMIQVLMSNWSKTLNDSNDESLNNAGKCIGMLERLFVFTFVVSGNWEAIGFLLAAKSVFRFGDLKESKDRKLTEYILIGTLSSFGIAIATGMIVLKLMN